MKTIFSFILLTFIAINIFPQNIFLQEITKEDIEAIKISLTKDPSLINKIISPNGETPIMIICQVVPNYSIAKLFIDKGALINAKDHDGMTPLMHSLSFFNHRFSEKKKIFFLLLDNGAYIDAQNRSGWTPLMMAVNIGDEDLIKKLIELNVNLNIHNGDNKTALDIANEKGNNKIIKLLTKNEAIVTQ